MRFGPPIPIPEIHEALKPHFQNDPAPKMMPTPGGVMSIFSTDSTPEEVADSLKEVSPDLPFFVMPLDSNRMQIPGLFERLGENVQSEEVRPTLTVDQILDKISDSGMESLTEEEKATLEANRGSYDPLPSGSL